MIGPIRGRQLHTKGHEANENEIHVASIQSGGQHAWLILKQNNQSGKRCKHKRGRRKTSTITYPNLARTPTKNGKLSKSMVNENERQVDLTKSFSKRQKRQTMAAADRKLLKWQIIPKKQDYKKIRIKKPKIIAENVATRNAYTMEYGIRTGSGFIARMKQS